MSEFAAWMIWLALGILLGVQLGIDIQQQRQYRKVLKWFEEDRIARYKELKRKEYGL